jgi:CRISPR-associated protein Csd1
MTILTALSRLYDRMAENGEAPRPGYATEKISFALVLDADGTPMRLADKRSHAGKKPAPVPMSVPAGGRTSGIKPNLLWDKTAYVFGVIAVEEEDEDGEKRLVPGQGKRTAKEHAAFVEEHAVLLEGATDPGLVALCRFLDLWQPDMFAELGFPTGALDQNIVFEFDDGTGQGFIHDRPAALDLVTAPAEAEPGLCLVTGDEAPIERLHPKIKGVMGAQSSGASLVSFNIGSKDERGAASSFGKVQGDNAPVSQRAAFAYGTALNALLARDSTRHLRIGDSTVVFWAEADDSDTANAIEFCMSGAFNPPADDDAELGRLRAAINDVATGRPAAPELDPATRVYILGLAPNAARLSVRFWYPGTFGGLARHVARFWEDLSIEPAPWKGPPAAWSLLYETAIRVGGKPKADTIPPLLGGQLMRAVLTGQPLPRTLLSAVIPRIRADGDINGRRAAICKAVINSRLRLNRDQAAPCRPTTKEEIPVSLDPDNINPAYRLGRLFAVLERAQSAALPGLNATIKDRYFAAASATPARVFPLLVKNATHHLALLKKGENGGLGHWLEKELGTIWLGLEADMPRSLPLEDQGRFIAGYYHQRWTKTDKNEVVEEITDNEEPSQ